MLENEELKARMDRIIHWVEVCDTKTSIILSVQILVITVISSTDIVIDSIKFILRDTFFYEGDKVFSFWACMVISLFLALVLLCYRSLYYFFNVLKAKKNADLTREQNIRDKDSLIHFQCIADKGVFDKYVSFKEKENSENKEAEKEDLLSQIYINAVRCNEKFDDYNAGLKWLIWAILALVLFFVSVLFYQASLPE